MGQPEVVDAVGKRGGGCRGSGIEAQQRRRGGSIGGGGTAPTTTKVAVGRGEIAPTKIFGGWVGYGSE